MKFDCLKGECEECGENKFVFIPHGEKGTRGICIDCLIKLKRQKENDE